MFVYTVIFQATKHSLAVYIPAPYKVLFSSEVGRGDNDNTPLTREWEGVRACCAMCLFPVCKKYTAVIWIYC